MENLYVIVAPLNASHHTTLRRIRMDTSTNWAVSMTSERRCDSFKRVYNCLRPIVSPEGSGLCPNVMFECPCIHALRVPAVTI